jgi:hypothetical protein
MAKIWPTNVWKQETQGGAQPPKWSEQRQRVSRYIDCHWVSPYGEQQTRISSISPTGCYIDSRFTVPPEGTHVREICLMIPGGEELSVHGTVLCPTPGIGFAVRFAAMDDDTLATLNGLVFGHA